MFTQRHQFQRIQYLDCLDHYVVHLQLALAEPDVKQLHFLCLLLFFFFFFSFLGFSGFFLSTLSLTRPVVVAKIYFQIWAYESRLGPDQDFRYVTDYIATVVDSVVNRRVALRDCLAIARLLLWIVESPRPATRA